MSLFAITSNSASLCLSPSRMLSCQARSQLHGCEVRRRLRGGFFPAEASLSALVLNIFVFSCSSRKVAMSSSNLLISAKVVAVGCNTNPERSSDCCFRKLCWCIFCSRCSSRIFANFSSIFLISAYFAALLTSRNFMSSPILLGSFFSLCRWTLSRFRRLSISPMRFMISMSCNMICCSSSSVAFCFSSVCCCCSCWSDCSRSRRSFKSSICVSMALMCDSCALMVSVWNVFSSLSSS
mmetsp:Transcript_25223/g.69555  ORF Transcript_25223/g.69555 Transcript_25223/m.69555 type:complete len:238 (+) Transcript_25223:2733-3446(+)